MTEVAIDALSQHFANTQEPGSPPSGVANVGFNAHLSFNSSRGHQDQSSDKLRSKLVDVGHRFIGFDKIVEEDTLVRKDTEQKRIDDAKIGLTKLEKALNVEIKRRVEANKTVQEMTETLANNMLDRLQSKILARIEKLTKSLDSMTTRCGALESGIQQFKGELPTKLHIDTAALIKEIDFCRTSMEADKKHRSERDTAYLRRIAEVEYGIDSKFETGFAIMEQQTASLKQEILSLSRTDESTEDQFRAFILEEVAALKNSLSLAAQAREQTDDEIVQAINQYTNALHKGLRAANSR
jgi:transcriptional regulator NrdR family protein